MEGTTFSEMHLNSTNEYTVVIETLYNTVMSAYTRLSLTEQGIFLNAVKIVNGLPIYQFFSKDRVEDYRDIGSPINIEYEDVFIDAYLATKTSFMLKGIDFDLSSIVNDVFEPLIDCDLGNSSKQIYSLSELSELPNVLKKRPWLSLAFCFFSLSVAAEFIDDAEQLQKGE